MIKEIGKYITAISYNEGNAEYIGKADPDSNKANAVWQIVKLSYTGENMTDIQYADGDLSFDNIWDDRASLSYS